MKDIENALLGRTIVRAEIDLLEDNFLRITCLDAIITLRVDGDCCSYSYFVAHENPCGRVLGVEDRSDNLSVQETRSNETTILYHALLIKTDQGHFTIDWRNSSNGWYDGTIALESVVAR